MNFGVLLRRKELRKGCRGVELWRCQSGVRAGIKGKWGEVSRICKGIREI